jgi:hypothetical protein
MKKTLMYLTVCGTLLVAGPLAFSADESKAIGRKGTVLTSITASVEAIDPAKREVTLKGPLGNTVTFTVDKRVKRLNEIKVGDLVTADYYVSVAAELRKPTAEEEKEPIQLIEAGAKAPAEASPAIAGARRFKVVTTVEGLDRPTKTVTVKGPMGHYHTARVDDPSRLTELRIGDKIVLTFTEAMAVSLEKAHKKHSE